MFAQLLIVVTVSTKYTESRRIFLFLQEQENSMAYYFRVIVLAITNFVIYT